MLRAAAALTVVSDPRALRSRSLSRMGCLSLGAARRRWSSTLWAATPAFAFLTGALVWTMHPPRSGADLGRFFSRRVSVVVVPYVAWSLVYILFVRPMPHIAGARDLAAFAHRRGAAHRLRRRLVPPLLHPGGADALSARAAGEPRVAPLPVGAAGRRLRTGRAARLRARGALRAPRERAQRPGLARCWFLPFAAAGAWYGALRDRVQPWVARLWPLLLAAGLVLRWRDLAGRFMPNPLAQRSFEIVYMLAILLGFFGALQLLRRLAPIVMAPASALAATSYTVYLAHPLAIRGLESAVRALRLEALWGSPLFAFAAIAGVAAFCHACARLALRVPATAWIVRGPLRRRETSPLVSLPAEEPVLETAGEA